MIRAITDDDDDELTLAPQAAAATLLRERAKSVGGWLDVSSQPGSGTSIILSVPLDGTQHTPEEPSL